MSQKKKLKFGILCNSLVFEAWEAACIKQLLQHPAIELQLLVVNQEAHSPRPTVLQKLKAYPYKSFLFRAYKRYLLKAKAFQNISLEEQFKTIPKLECTTIKKGKHSAYFDEKDVAHIKAFDLDFMLRFGFNIIKGDILESCKYGIWSFHHADNDFIRGGPIGFWEIYLKYDNTAAVLQQLNNKLDQGKTLRKGYLKTINHSYAENIDQLAEMTAIWPLQVCIDLLNEQSVFHAQEEITPKAKLYKYPTNYCFLQFVLILIMNKIKFHVAQLFMTESWQVVKFEGAIEHIVSQPIPKPDSITKSCSETYCADPFLWPNEAEKLMLFEYFSYKENVGKIAMSDYDGKRFKILDFGLKSHMSYPYCFEFENQVYCLPEQASSNKVSLYKINENGQVNKLKDLIHDFEARDPSLIYFQQKWWLFCTKANYFENAALFIFSANSLFDDFLPHQNNPVKVDVQNARPAGALFLKNNELYRPAQNSAKHYGNEVNINKIITLSTIAFQEEIVQTINATNFGDYKGIHHISNHNGHTVIDLKTTRFSLYNFKFQMLRKFKKMSKF